MQRITKSMKLKSKYRLPMAFTAMLLAMNLSFSGCGGTVIDSSGLSDDGGTTGMTDGDPNGNNLPGDGGNGDGSNVDNGQDGNGNNGDGNNDAGNSQDVDDSLGKFGVDTSFTARVDDKQDDIDEDFSPLGSSFTMAQTD